MILTCVHWKLSVLQKEPVLCQIRKTTQKPLFGKFVPTSLKRQKFHISKGKGLYAYCVSFWEVRCKQRFQPHFSTLGAIHPFWPFIWITCLSGLYLMTKNWKKKTKKKRTKQNIPFWNAFRASLWPSLHYWKNCNQSNCNFCQRFFFYLLFQDERFAFSRDTRDDAVFTSLTGKIPQVNFTDSVFSF